MHVLFLEHDVLSPSIYTSTSLYYSYSTLGCSSYNIGLSSLCTQRSDHQAYTRTLEQSDQLSNQRCNQLSRIRILDQDDQQANRLPIPVRQQCQQRLLVQNRSSTNRTVRNCSSRARVVLGETSANGRRSLPLHSSRKTTTTTTTTKSVLIVYLETTHTTTEEL